MQRLSEGDLASICFTHVCPELRSGNGFGLARLIGNAY
jgi:hypothetical protein